MLGAAALMLITFGLLTRTTLAVPLDRPLPMMLIFIQGTAFSAQYVLFFRLQKRSGPVVLSLLGSVAAVVGVPISVFWLGESWPGAIIPAAILIATGIGLVSLRGSSRSRPSVGPPFVGSDIDASPVRTSSIPLGKVAE